MVFYPRSLPLPATPVSCNRLVWSWPSTPQHLTCCLSILLTRGRACHLSADALSDPETLRELEAMGAFGPRATAASRPKKQPGLGSTAGAGANAVEGRSASQPRVAHADLLNEFSSLMKPQAGASGTDKLGEYWVGLSSACFTFIFASSRLTRTGCVE